MGLQEQTGQTERERQPENQDSLGSPGSTLPGPQARYLPPSENVHEGLVLTIRFSPAITNSGGRRTTGGEWGQQMTLEP